MALEVTVLANVLTQEQFTMLLRQADWGKNRTPEVIQKSLEHSLTVGAFLADGTAVGMARIVTDYATFGYLCDVVVAEPYRGQGISKAIMDYIMELDFVKGLRRFNLLTASANELYRRYGFTELKDPGRYMEVFKDM